MGNKQLKECLDSLLSSTSKVDFDINIIRERKYRRAVTFLIEFLLS